LDTDDIRLAIGEAASSAALDELGRRLWRGYGQGQIDDNLANALSSAIEARRASLRDFPHRRLGKPLEAPQGHPGPGGRSLLLASPRQLRPRREKVFGVGRPRPLSHNAKARIMRRAEALTVPTEPGKHYGLLTNKALLVLKALLWGFHNAGDGRCFPSYEAIAEKARCARSTVAEAIKALEDAGILSWVNRIKRVRERVGDIFGGWGATIERVVRTSNAYHFVDPEPENPPAAVGNASKSELRSGTQIQNLNLSTKPPKPPLSYPHMLMQIALT
jgi:DNA-binding MarR family transcriptional regulator